MEFAIDDEHVAVGQASSEGVQRPLPAFPGEAEG